MKRFCRRKKAGITAAVLLAVYVLLGAVPASADVQKGTEPDYRTDYYMIVESKAGGVDIYSDPDLDSTKLNDSLIPNGTALRIEGEVEDEKDKRLWGYTQYHGMYGYVPEDDLKPAQSRQEAIDSELYIAGSDHVNYNTDYDVTVDSDEDGIHLYQGPGEKYGPVPGTDEIKNGETLHIVQDAEMVDGSRWGVTDSLEKGGWVNLDETREGKDTGIQKEDVDGKTEPDTAEIPETAAGAGTSSAGTAESPEAEEKVEPMIAAEAEEKAEPTKAAEAEEKVELTEAAEAEEKTEPTKAAEAEEKAEPTIAAEAEEKSESTKAPEAEEKAEPMKTPEAAQTQAAEEEEAADASSQNVETTGTARLQPLILIALAGIAAVIILIIYHIRKNNG